MHGLPVSLGVIARNIDTDIRNNTVNHSASLKYNEPAALFVIGAIFFFLYISGIAHYATIITYAIFLLLRIGVSFIMQLADREIGDRMGEVIYMFVILFFMVFYLSAMYIDFESHGLTEFLRFGILFLYICLGLFITVEVLIQVLSSIINKYMYSDASNSPEIPTIKHSIALRPLIFLAFSTLLLAAGVNILIGRSKGAYVEAIIFIAASLYIMIRTYSYGRRSK